MKSASARLAETTQTVVAPGESFSRPAFAAVRPTNECARLSILKNQNRPSGDGGAGRVAWRVGSILRSSCAAAREAADSGIGLPSLSLALRAVEIMLKRISAASFFLPCLL